MVTIGQVRLHPNVLLSVQIDNYGTQLLTAEQWDGYATGILKVAAIARYAETLDVSVLQTPKTSLKTTIQKAASKRNASR